jgi:hypothetical protein
MYRYWNTSTPTVKEKEPKKGRETAPRRTKNLRGPIKYTYIQGRRTYSRTIQGVSQVC